MSDPVCDALVFSLAHTAFKMTQGTSIQQEPWVLNNSIIQIRGPHWSQSHSKTFKLKYQTLLPKQNVSKDRSISISSNQDLKGESVIESSLHRDSLKQLLGVFPHLHILHLQSSLQSRTSPTSSCVGSNQGFKHICS